MNEDRRKAFASRIEQLIGDHEKRFGFFKKASREDLEARMLSALEDAFQMGAMAQAGSGPRVVTALLNDAERAELARVAEPEVKVESFQSTGKEGPSIVLGAFTEEEIAKAADRVAERYEPKEP